MNISKLFIWCDTNSSCEHITGGVNIYLHGWVILLASAFDVFVCVCVCVILNQSTSKKYVICQTSVKLKTDNIITLKPLKKSQLKLEQNLI